MCKVNIMSEKCRASLGINLMRIRKAYIRITTPFSVTVNIVILKLYWAKLFFNRKIF